jgi:hypothetical protein
MKEKLGPHDWTGVGSGSPKEGPRGHGHEGIWLKEGRVWKRGTRSALA